MRAYIHVLLLPAPLNFADGFVAGEPSKYELVICAAAALIRCYVPLLIFFCFTFLAGSIT